jgi:phenylalanyl-tRNA synthetase alpha chain
MEDIISKLHPLEKAIIPILKDGISYIDIIEKSGLKDVEVMRALQWLSNKEIIKLEETKEDLIELDINGKLYSKEGLPELRFLKVLSETESKTQEEIIKEANLNPQEFGVSIGTLKKKVAILSENSIKGITLKRTMQGTKLIQKESLEEQFLKKDFPISLNSLAPEEKFAYDNLIQRKQILKKDTKKTITITVTEICREIQKNTDSLSKEYTDNLTHSMISSGKWKNAEFRHYDIKINVPKISGAKRHFVKQSIDYIKRVWLDMGFKEMEGNMVQSSFWDLDSLFVPQDHPARTMQDTFYIENPKTAKLPKGITEKVKAIHENGGDTCSKGWGGNWSTKEASLNMLRTHTTVLSAQTISKLKPNDLPAKFFSVNKVFRNEALTWKHLFEFHQVEGIVIDPNASLKHLKGYLREFYNKLGFEKVRMRPAHFPYTEPSLEVDVFHPEKKEWIELGGAGIFRPEVTKTLMGIDVPVLAWGQGLERGIMDFYKFKDIRHLYNNDLKIIKETKVWRQ